MHDIGTVLDEMRSNGSQTNRTGMARYGINTDQAVGVSMVWLRQKAKTLGRDHRLALDLWDSEVHEARILATLIDEPDLVTRDQMEGWVRQFDSWDVCDQCCNNLFIRTRFARNVIYPWCHSEEEFVKRAGFVMVAVLAVKDKDADSETFLPFLRMIAERSDDPRGNVKKAVSWALRQIGKRDLECHALALSLAAQMSGSDDRSVRWIGKDAERELRSEATLERVRKRDARRKAVSPCRE